MPNEKNYWTQPTTDGRWETKQEGGDVVQTFDTEAESWEFTKAQARASKGEAILKGENQQIRERNTYGNDPRETPG